MDFIQTFVQTIYNAIAASAYLTYPFIVVSAVLQQWFPIYPGDNMLLFIGYMASQREAGILMFLVYLIPAVAAVWLLYEFGRSRTPQFFKTKLITKPQLDFVFERLQNRAYWGLFICKFLPGCMFLALLICGFAKLPRKQVYIISGAATLAHNALLFGAGWLLQSNYGSFTPVLMCFNVLGLSLIVLSGALVVFALLRAKRKARLDAQRLLMGVETASELNDKPDDKT